MAIPSTCPSIHILTMDTALLQLFIPQQKIYTYINYRKQQHILEDQPQFWSLFSALLLNWTKLSCQRIRNSVWKFMEGESSLPWTKTFQAEGPEKKKSAF